MSDKTYTALVLAASRRGREDPLLEAGKVSHKCFLDIAGAPMLWRVVEAALDSGRVGEVVVSIDGDSIDTAKALLRGLEAKGKISFIAARDKLGGSVEALTESRDDILPLIITTGDNALHTAEMVRYFCDALDDSRADAALGLTDADVLLAKYPDGQRAFHHFRDGAFSSCNLYALMTPAARKAPRTFNSGGQFGKKPWRIIFAFGLPAFLLYKSRLASLNGFLKTLSRGLGLRVDAIPMPFAEGPIDVDRVSDWEKANAIVAAREKSALH